MSEKRKAIEIVDLLIDYGNSIAIDKINLEVEKGDLVTLLGPSGCGKSTTLNALAGLITSTSGKIYFDGKNVTKLSPKEREIGLVFQSYALYPHMTVYKNIAFPLTASNDFKEEIAKINKAVDLKIIEYKYKQSSEKDWNILFSEITKYDEKISSLEEEMEIVKFKTKNNIKLAKDLEFQAKVKRDGRKKAASVETLNIIENNNLQKENLIEESKIIKSNVKFSENEKEELLNKIRSTLKEIEIANEETFANWKEKLITISNDYKEAKEFAKKEKNRIISEVKEWQNKEIQRLAEEKEKFILKSKDKYQSNKEKINSTISNLVLTKEQEEQIKEIAKEKTSYSYEVDKRVREVAERVGITNQLEKKVTALSGGQQQRVAISRTLVKRPKILLLDEPLSNLDAKMRVQTREWIRSLQQELGITTVFVTHDQEEAMSISDKIVCMSDGLIQQVAEPMDMYHNPANKFVAGFLGMPQMNFFTKETKLFGEISKLHKKTKIGTFGIRPEHVKLEKEIKPADALKIKVKAEVYLVESFGREKLITAILEDGTKIKLFTEDINIDTGDTIKVLFKKNKIYCFDNTKFGKTVGRI